VAAEAATVLRAILAGDLDLTNPKDIDRANALGLRTFRLTLRQAINWLLVGVRDR
jgi:hypothetical protein